MNCKNVCECNCAKPDTVTQEEVKRAVFQNIETNVIYVFDKKGNQYFGNVVTGVVLKVSADGVLCRYDIS